MIPHQIEFNKKGIGMAEEFEKWSETQEFHVPLDSSGKIIDILDKNTLRENTPEERIRQRMVNILIHELNYPPQNIALERVIKSGRQNIRADIVVYNSEEACIKNDQGQIHFTGETKAPMEKCPDGQEKSYISSSSAQGGFWTNGSIIYYYRKNISNGSIIDWIGLPKFGNTWDSVGKYKKSDLIIPIDLKLAFKRCHNAIYRAGIDSEDVALDMVRILLAKIEDESSADENCKFYITQDEYNDERLKTNACLRIKELFRLVKNKYGDVFSEYEEISASDNQLSIVISHIQQYALLDAPYDVIGTAYEVYVASHLKGERGQFFTNRHVINMMVSMLNPKETDIILDPACGSGGFLLSAMNYIFKNIELSNRGINAKDILKRNVVHQLFGIDISPKLVKIAKANMLLGKDGHGGIERGNSLDTTDKLTAKFKEKADIGMVSIILTNPPFGSGYDIKIKEPNILKNFATGRSWRQDDSGTIIYDDKLNSSSGVAPELLFLERCIEWLKPGGYLGIVMAKGQLDNREAYAIRHRVLSVCNVLSVVNLHEDTFEPFCGSKASVLFLRKKLNKHEPQKHRIFMAISNKIGQTSRGEAIFKRDSDG
jgi:type I restriction enzyme M protein